MKTKTRGGLAVNKLKNRDSEPRFLTNSDVASVYDTNAVLSMQRIFQHHQNGLEGYRHHNQATFASFSEIQHPPMVFCVVPLLDGFEDR
jgi:hypothetical protein